MRKYILYINLFISLIAFSQNEQLAQQYFDKGDFEKALISYQELLKTQTGNSFYFQKMIESEQQLQQYVVAEKAIQERLEKYKQSYLLVELGYNFQLQKQDEKAKTYFDQAIEKVKENPNEAYGVAAAFEKKVLIDYALLTYETAIAADPKLNFNFQMALLYGQKGKTDLMIEKFLEESYDNPQNLIGIQGQLARFMTEESENSFNESLRKALVIRTQKNQDIFWNEFLSWYYVQQKQYGKAFIQEKAIYKRDPESFSNIINLGELAIEEGEDETAKEILTFVIENTQDIDLLVQSNYFLLKMKINKATEAELKLIETELEQKLSQFGISPYTLSLQILQAHFVTFKTKNPELGKTILKTALELPLNKYQLAEVKMELADIFLYDEKFNQALLFYSQIEEDLKNDVIGHEASLKAAKTSYFKGEFDWALSQFKVLKSASSQLIANDALEYFLLINDNTAADSTQTALKQLARADYLLYQNKNQEALTKLQEIINSFKGQTSNDSENPAKEIESVVLLRLGTVYEKLGDFTAALCQYEDIINLHSDGIYVDEALYFSAEIENKQFKNVEKAKALYEKIVFKHEDSIYFVDARKKFRQLRGDTNL